MCARIYQTPFNRIKRRGRTTLSFFPSPSLSLFNLDQRTKVEYSRQLGFALHADNHKQRHPFYAFPLSFSPSFILYFIFVCFQPIGFLLSVESLSTSSIFASVTRTISIFARYLVAPPLFASFFLPFPLPLLLARTRLRLLFERHIALRVRTLLLLLSRRQTPPWSMCTM